MRYRIYDSKTNELLIESNDIYEIGIFITLNPSGNLLSFVREKNSVIKIIKYLDK